MFLERLAIMMESGLDKKKSGIAASQDTAKKYWETLKTFHLTGWSRKKIERFLER